MYRAALYLLHVAVGDAKGGGDGETQSPTNSSVPQVL